VHKQVSKKKHTVCTQCVHSVYTVCTHCVHSVYTVCTQCTINISEAVPRSVDSGDRLAPDDGPTLFIKSWEDGNFCLSKYNIRPVFRDLPEPNRAWLLVVYFSR